MNDIASIITELEQRGVAIENAIAALRGIGGESTAPTGRGRPRGWAKKKAGGKKATKKRGLTAAGRKALSENMKRLWREKKLGKGR